MTEKLAGMTEKLAGMTEKLAGMTEKFRRNDGEVGKVGIFIV